MFRECNKQHKKYKFCSKRVGPGRRSRGETTDLEPCGSIRDNLYGKAESRGKHGRRDTWQHGSSHLRGGRAMVQLCARSRMVAWELTPVRRRRRGATTGIEPPTSMGARLYGEAERRDLPRARSYVPAREPASTGWQSQGSRHEHGATWQHGSPPL
jgi:hypothetical protein